MVPRNLTPPPASDLSRRDLIATDECSSLSSGREIEGEGDRDHLKPTSLSKTSASRAITHPFVSQWLPINYG